MVAVAAEKQMEDVKTGGPTMEPMDTSAAAAACQEEAPPPVATAEDAAVEAGGLGAFEATTTGSLSETNALANAGPPSPLTGCYLLIILGEPHSEAALRVIVEQLKQGESKIRLRHLYSRRLAEKNRNFLSGGTGKFRLRHFLSQRIRSPLWSALSSASSSSR